MLNKIIKSIKTSPLNLILIVVALAGYIINNAVLKEISGGFFKVFFVGYFNDLLCPLFFVSYVNLLLITQGKELRKMHHILLLCLLAGIVWEFLAPLFKKSSVTDMWDIACYLIGGAVYRLIFLCFSRKERRF